MALGGGGAKGGYSVVAKTGQVLAPGSGAILPTGSSGGCPGNVGKIKDASGKYVCPPAATAAAAGPAGGSMLNFATPGMPAQTTVPRGGPAPPTLGPIDPQAAYDPELSAQLARQRSVTSDYERGTGFAEDVRTGAQRDTAEARMRVAEQAAAQAGIPFDRARFEMEEARADAAARADLTLGREAGRMASVGAESQVAAEQAGERTDRLGLDLTRDTTENAQKIDLYGEQNRQYATDVNASVAANNALMDFYSRLTSGAFSAMGSIGGGNYSSNMSFGA